MLTRLLEPDRGKILINSKDIKNINAQNLREICSYIDQNLFFLKDPYIIIYHMVKK